MRRSIRRGLGSLVLGVSLALAATPAFAQEPLVVLLVRHAEKIDDSRDPVLSPAGEHRAAELASALRDSGIAHVHSTDFIRTRTTAGPVAERLGLEVEIYDPFDMPGFIAHLRAMGGRHLVVGHSNTTPGAVQLLGGDPGEPIEESDEYDRLYVVTIAADGDVSTVLMRFGRPPGG